ncbi:MAG: DUF1573 domain-containing protein [Verrucomicrobia bacterium]|jgi:mono/diheme cytochrome c family protein|nr:DUF1573 domain-containing protein [Verrucomicrobiota bacterium]
MLKQSILLVLLGTGALAMAESVPISAPPRPPTGGSSYSVIPSHSPNVVVTEGTPPAGAAPATTAAIPPAYRPLPDGVLVWDGETQETRVKFGTAQAFTQFNLTNISQEPITVNAVRTSCGCTVPKLPPMPWTLAPGTSGTIDVTMNLAGKQGTVVKTVTVTTDQGFKTLYVRTIIEEAAAGVMGQTDRLRNLQIASANRQAVFQGDCVTCHVTPALNKTGAELFDNACGICHEAEHRASMVPDLKNLQKETNADYWRTWITTSMDGKLMPAFALEHGGFLNAMQIDSLVDYLVATIPSQAPATPAPANP